MFIRKILVGMILVPFLSSCVPVDAGELLLPPPSQIVMLSAAFNPPVLKGIKVYTDNPLRFDFILDKGDEETLTDDQVKSDSTRLIKYFLASLTIPEKDLWVNLSPYEKDRIVPEAFGQTEMGRDLLAQDYMLKQITASVIYPEEKIGRKFWDKVYTETQRRFGSTDVPVVTFNKVWIVPEKAVVYENKDATYVVESHLKVLLEEDYLALEKETANIAEKTNAKETNKLGAQIVREIVIPILEKEVNEGKNFSQLRQIYYSLILALWFKDKIRESILGQAYVDQDKVAGVDIKDKAEKERIWAQYVEAFKKGSYNYIKEDYDAGTQQMIPRKYFFGGVGLFKTKLSKSHDAAQLPEGRSDRAMVVESNLLTLSTSQIPDAAMMDESDLQNAWLQAAGIDEIRDKVTGKLLVEKDGSDSHLPLSLWKLVRTDAFKQWFGDWQKHPEQASKVVDENGEPLVVYHMGGAYFTYFDKKRIGSYDLKNGGKPRIQSSLGAGMFFSVNQETLEKFSDAYQPVLYTVFLNLRNPKLIDSKFLEHKLLVVNEQRKKGQGIRSEWNTASLERREELRQEMVQVNNILELIAKKETQDLQNADPSHDASWDKESEYLDRHGTKQRRPADTGYAICVFDPEAGTIKSIYNIGTFTSDGNEENVKDILENGRQQQYSPETLRLINESRFRLILEGEWGIDDVERIAFKKDGQWDVVTKSGKRYVLKNLGLNMLPQDGVSPWNPYERAGAVNGLRMIFMSKHGRGKDKFDDFCVYDGNGFYFLEEVSQEHKNHSWDIEKYLGGATGAFQVLLSDGSRKVLKFGANPEQAESEGLANWLYREAGVDVPEMRSIYIDARRANLFEFIEGERLSYDQEESLARVTNDFVVDAWLANWDVVGSRGNNIIKTDDGRIFRIDNGGALDKRAKGEWKGLAWGKTVKEISTMRHKSDDTNIFERLSDADVAAQIRALSGRMTPEKIKHAIEMSGYPEDKRTRMYEVLLARLDDMRRFANSVVHQEATKSGIPTGAVYAKEDSAINSPGGIDLTHDRMNMQTRGSGKAVQFNFDPAMIRQVQNASGLTPVIIDIHPMTTSVPMFLGIKDDVSDRALNLR